ncbi:hypothetical protein F3Y22_tig00110482pilonHSYRG00310 [Hibiscus syriacus]|uniref:DUF7780 domain-containing protein n=1 Tax=Hibiscus syriacus TaxID=106335 RepID=A0A6A3AI28_HIBSY|nr:uncharacterized protein LOC120128645 [Hibiscus syriacus]KAE8702549.1 hypothetical protein F3Y22_tig00110482pilonHSYRG00310 [Hibiscus syriacus]
MGLAAVKGGSNTSNGNKESKGMSLLLVFFHGGGDQNKITTNSSFDNQNTTTPRRFIKRTSTSTLLSSKAQSTISICLLLLLLTLLLFTLSTFEPSPTIKNPRRILSQNTQFTPPPFKSFFPMWDYKSLNVKQKPSVFPSSFALQRMGTLYRRGTKAMNDLIVSHVVEDFTEDELRLFLRVLHRSGITSKADIVFLFASPFLSSRFSFVIHEENESFLKLIQHHVESNNKGSRDSVLGFDSTQFWKYGKKDVGETETIWGKKGSRGNSCNSTAAESESTRLTYGSVVGFDVNELDPENSLAGFLDHVSMSFRRWACYPMLLGRIRRNFKHIMLLDVKSLLLLSDPLDSVRNRSPESVYLLTKESGSGKHGKRNSDKTKSHSQINSAILMGGARGIRRLANAMLTEIVRAAMQHKKKKKDSISESEILSQLVGTGHVLKNVDLITSTESIQEASSLTGSKFNSAGSDYSIIQRGNSNHDLNSVIMQLICLRETNSYVYRDC